ncbi:protein FAM111A-like [Anabas testudineus]|uniref:protein FAM111A-like n=1 Tax=Anabas testudineus TaxID=64144 RepID=UPI000E458BFC|nr:protein FAM111A-like [Anabas testudineus]XP_026225269.1 protein FAM111A-like [Anabas testudineus]
MPPTKRKTEGQKDIRSFFEKESNHPGSSTETSTGTSQPGGAAASETFTGCQARVKEENDGDSVEEHLHRFIVKFSRTDRKEYNISCDQPRTVLEVIKSNELYKKMNKYSDDHIVIQLGKEDRASIVATHFPCSCIRDGECLIISGKPEKVEEAKDQHYQMIHPRNKYSVFYIDREGGINTKTKELFRSTAVKQFKYLCVYGEKGMTVKEAVKRDGRFIDLDYFELSDNENPNVFTGCSERVDKLDQKEFKICLPLNRKGNDEGGQENQGAANRSEHRPGTKAILDAAQQSGISLKTVVEKSSSDKTEEIYEILRQQFPELKELMESRFTENSYQEELKLRKENFGKIQQSFSEVHRVRKLLKLGQSVCKVVVEGVCMGTGFVLFDNFILTNAHLFNNCVEGQKLQDGIDVFALFNYDEPEPNTNYYYFISKTTFIDFDRELDYAILELNTQPQKPNIKLKKNIKMPPGLLKEFGPVPQNGEACIIGHPNGEVKKMDPTCIIETEKRGQAVSDHLHSYKDTLIIHLLSQVIKDQGIENIMMGGNEADDVVTYNTFMYHGASGSPVFDARCKVFGLHTAGYAYGFPRETKSVIEFARPLLSIFENFVRKLKENGNRNLLKRVEKEADSNQHLKQVLKSESDDLEEPMDVDEE